MVRKYELKEDCVTGHIDLEEDTDGGWVSYEDYKELDDRFQDYVTETEMEVAELVARLAEVNAELQKYKYQFPDCVECANCGYVTHVEGVEPDGEEPAWVVWYGGENPAPGKRVDVKFRDSGIAYDDDSCRYRWWLCKSERDSDIIAYRVVGKK